MALISLKEVSLGFGGADLLDHINLQIECGERVGVLGRNGMGKSTLLKLLNGDLSPDEGIVSRQQNLRSAYLAQEVPQGLHGNVIDVVTNGSEQLSGTSTGDDVWQRQLFIEQILSRMQLDSRSRVDNLSAGNKRRVLLACALAKNPDILLLDEPTNHLDIVSINWLEDFLSHWGKTLVFVTHDRAFLQRLAVRIIELDRGRLFDWKCSYSLFVKRKEALLADELDKNVVFDKILAQEEGWIRRGIEARRRRNEGRVRALKRLREVRRERREQPAKVRMQIQEEKRCGRLVIEAEGLGFSFDEQVVLQNFSITIQRGDRVGILGENGSGKTTLLRLLIGELLPQKGYIRLGTNLEIAYFDQLRSQLDESKSIMDNVGQGGDTITINGKKRSLIGYLSDFLFTPDIVHAPIYMLSGGERNRLLLARLFSMPANLLVLDEPTNDLDIETLELLEDCLLDYNGTLLLVSHDRAFLNNIVTSMLVLDGSGAVREYVGGYDDWLQHKLAEDEEKNNPDCLKEPPARDIDEKSAELSVNSGNSIHKRGQQRKLSYKEQLALEEQQRELADLPAKIERLETEQKMLGEVMADAAFYQRDNEDIIKDANRLKQLEAELDQAYRRWEELEGSID